MTLSIAYDVDSVFALRKKRSYGLVEIFSFVGGILGLFAGFSVISGFEVLYYFVIYSCFKRRKKLDILRVYPIENYEFVESKNDNFGSKFWKFLQEILNNSSVHSFSQIGGDDKVWFDR